MVAFAWPSLSILLNKNDVRLSCAEGGKPLVSLLDPSTRDGASLKALFFDGGNRTRTSRGILNETGATIPSQNKFGSPPKRRSYWGPVDSDQNQIRPLPTDMRTVDNSGRKPVRSV